MDDLDVLSRYPVSRHRLSVADECRLADAGIRHEDDRVELLEGQLITMSPVDPRHALAVDALTDLLSHAVSPPARVSVQNRFCSTKAASRNPILPWAAGHGGAIRRRIPTRRYRSAD